MRADEKPVQTDEHWHDDRQYDGDAAPGGRQQRPEQEDHDTGRQGDVQGMARGERIALGMRHRAVDDGTGALGDGFGDAADSPADHHRDERPQRSPLSFLDLHTQTTTTVATRYTKIGRLTVWITVSAGTNP